MTWFRKLAVGLLFVSAVAACKPSIGDKCTISTDCSTQGDRLCDTSQPDGYCTQFNCRGNTCPDRAACVLFNSAVPGCLYDDRDGRFGGRTGRSFCVERCESDGDCRAGYVCASPLAPQYGALILDNDQTQKTCLVKPSSDVASATTAQVCGPGAPDAAAPIDAGEATLDSGLPPFTGPEALDAGTDAGDAGADAADGG